MVFGLDDAVGGTAFARDVAICLEKRGLALAGFVGWWIHHILRGDVWGKD